MYVCTKKMRLCQLIKPSTSIFSNLSLSLALSSSLCIFLSFNVTFNVTFFHFLPRDLDQFVTIYSRNVIIVFFGTLGQNDIIVFQIAVEFEQFVALKNRTRIIRTNFKKCSFNLWGIMQPSSKHTLGSCQIGHFSAFISFRSVVYKYNEKSMKKKKAGYCHSIQYSPFTYFFCGKITTAKKSSTFVSLI